MSKMHDFTSANRCWGHDIHFTLQTADGHRLTAGGWGKDIKQGDYLLLSNGANSTRYRVESIEYFSNPSDQWQGILVFAPRQEEQP